MALLLSLTISLLISTSSTMAADYLFYTCNGGNYTTNSTFQSSLYSLLNSLSTSNVTYTTDAKGSIPDVAYGLIMCRGDLNLTVCTDCVETAARDVISVCPKSKQATIWYDFCLLHYADSQFLGTAEKSYYLLMHNANFAVNPKGFVKMEMTLLEMVIYQAAYNSSSSMFATGMAVNGTAPAPKIYALAQCTRDLSMDDCSQCLQQIRGYYGGDQPTKEGGRILVQSCIFRYESYPFFEGDPILSLDMSNLFAPVSSMTPQPYELPSPPPEPPTSASNGKGTDDNTRKILLIAIPGAVGLLLIIIFIICFLRRSAKKVTVNDEIHILKINCSVASFVDRCCNFTGTTTLEEISNGERLLFDLFVLKAATNNFAESQKLGQGGFGTVYKGTLPSGEDVAVKRLSASSRQGIEELKNELILVAKLQHKNLVKLRGVCLEEDEKLLVYEYVPNGSLDGFLFDPVNCKQLNWERRFKIIQGMAQGLLYLHEECPLKVIHRDLKASNVLIDVYMQPKIADFGLARLFGEDETQHITSRVVGTFGYMAPEYATRGHFSMKLDVYSFGILVLEIVTGKRCTSFQYNSEISQDILSFTWEHWKNGTTLEITDPSMGGKFSSNEVVKCIQIGLICTQEHPGDRPPMSLVFLMLHGPSMALQEPLQPSSVAGNVSKLKSAGSQKESTSGSSEESSRTVDHSTHEDRLIIKRSMSEAKKAAQNFVSYRNTT